MLGWPEVLDRRREGFALLLELRRGTEPPPLSLPALIAQAVNAGADAATSSRDQWRPDSGGPPAVARRGGDSTGVPPAGHSGHHA